MATMNTNIKINIVEPGSSTPVDPTPIDPVDPSDTTNTTTYTSSTDVSVPDTGLFTHGIGGTEATIYYYIYHSITTHHHSYYSNSTI